MANKKAIVVLSFLLIFASVLQVFPFNSADFDGVNSYAHDSKAVINAGVHSNTIAILNCGDKVNLLKVPASRSQFFYETSFFALLSSMHLSIDTGYVANTGKKIKNILHNHFNGTKYKGKTFVI